MAAFTTKFVVLLVALALLVSYASANCAIVNCLNCVLANPNQCLVCNTGYGLTASGGCMMANGASAPQSMAVAALVTVSAVLMHTL